MNRLQKVAGLQLVIIFLSFIAAIINSALYMRKYGYSFGKAWWFGSSWPIIICVFLIVLGPLFFYKKKCSIDLDERDLMIDRKAARFCFAAAFFFFLFSNFIVWGVVGIDELIPAYWLGRICLGGFFTAAIAHAAVTLILYGRVNKGVENE